MLRTNARGSASVVPAERIARTLRTVCAKDVPGFGEGPMGAVRAFDEALLKK